ncbi:MAG TPA: hypothetical protein VH307_18700 [Streptosporangiaceae bacterium]|nr:hypothetical protein [Streptosporangiaceae bacterium]
MIPAAFVVPILLGRALLPGAKILLSSLLAFLDLRRVCCASRSVYPLLAQHF